MLVDTNGGGHMSFSVSCHQEDVGNIWIKISLLFADSNGQDTFL